MVFWLSLAFIAFIATLVAFDLGLLSRRPRVVTPLEAATSFALWVLTAVGVSMLLAMAYQQGWIGSGLDLGRAKSGKDAWLQFVTAYVTEIALSLDNIAILTLIFEHFRVRAALRNRLLFWTVLVSILVRALLILAGAAALMWPPATMLFAGMLALATVRTLITPDSENGFERKALVRLLRRSPVRVEPENHRLTERRAGRLRGTPMLLVVMTAAAADFTFALDSIPAAFAITRDPLIALTSNILAVLALRSLYFWLADIVMGIRFIRVSLTLVLGVLTVKMATGGYDLTGTLVVLGLIVGIMAGGVGASVLRPRDRASLLRPRPAPLSDVAEAVVITRRNLRKVLVLIAGTSVLLLGVLIGFLPGPGFVILAPLGLAILATEFLWARRLLQRLKDQTASIQKQAGSLASRTPIWAVPLAVCAYAAVIALVLRYEPVPAKLVWMFGSGGLIALGYWAWTVISAYRERRRARCRATFRAPQAPGAVDPSPPSRTLS